MWQNLSRRAMGLLVLDCYQKFVQINTSSDTLDVL